MAAGGPVLETARLRLEPLTRAHAAEYFAILSDSRLFESIPHDPPATVEALEARFARLERGRSPDGRQAWLNWMIRVKASSICVGRVEASVDPDASAYFAYELGSEHWGRGFATEACARVIDALFRDHGVERITAEVDTRNLASIRLLERLGFERGGLKRGADFFKGAPSDELTYRLRRP